MTVMDNEDPALPAASEDEAWYDAEVAPALAALAKRCNERGMSFVATVEYEPGSRGGTYLLTKDAGLEMHMLHLCARTVPNVDGYIMGLHKFCATHGVDTGASFVMKRLGA